MASPSNHARSGVRTAEAAPGWAPPLPDVVGPCLRILFVGINPSLTSGRAGHHFAAPRNPFWRLLHAAGLTPTLLRPDEDWTLPSLGLGLTNLCARCSPGAADLALPELRAGAVALAEKVERLRPAVVAVVGVSLYAALFPGGREPGPGAKRARLGGAPVYFVPNPSGRNAAFPGFEQKRIWFERLGRYAARGTRARARMRG
jgi:TDG/mug DNA glycosylase family protein